MRRVQYHRYGGPEVLRLEDADLPAPAAGQVRVRVRAAAANAMDWKIRSGELRAMTGRAFPRGLGHDFAGVVETVGAGITRLHVGDEVLGAATPRQAGAFAELVLADEQGVAAKPEGLPFEHAATLPVVGVTALQALTRTGGVQPGQAVFVHGCLGGVGRAAVQLAKQRGAHVTGSCRPASAPLARDLGVDQVVDFDVDPSPLAHRSDLVLDTVGSLPITTARALLRPGGRIVDIVPTPRKFARSFLPGAYSVLMGRPDTGDLAEVAGAAAYGLLHLPIARTVPLADAIQAITDLERAPTSGGGKLVITMD